MKKPPATKPQWTAGEYAVHVDDQLIGYFRRFDSAYRWREYLAATGAPRVIYILHRGAIVSIWRADAAVVEDVR